MKSKISKEHKEFRENQDKKLLYGNSKYYIPTIEEFHVGFEYEQYIPSLKDYINDVHDMDNSQFIQNLYKKGLQDGWIRVKYLDREDIVKLGWSSAFTTIDDLSIPQWMFKSEYILHYFRDKQSTNIEYRISHNQRDIIFIGTIKNKSELKKLMEQLKIL